MSNETETLEVASLEALCTEVLEAAGARPAHAQTCVKILIEAELMGISTHGAVRLHDYARRLRAGGIDVAAEPKLERRAPSLALVDGANAVGPAVGLFALEAAIEGMGVTLAMKPLVRSEIEARRLVVPFDIAAPTAYSYYLVTPETGAASPSVASNSEDGSAPLAYWRGRTWWFSASRSPRSL